MDEQLRWNLADLYDSASDARIKTDIERAQSLADGFARRYRGRSAELKPGELKAALVELEALMDTAYRPQLYASLLFAGQTEDAASQALMNHTRQATTEVFNKVKFFDVELKKVPEDTFQAFLKAPELSSYQHHLLALRRFAPHTLSEAEERLADLKSLTGRSAFSQLYTEVSARIRVPVEVDGQRKEVTVAEARALRSHHNRTVRERATEGLMNSFEQQNHVLNFCFNTLFQDHRLEIEQRGYKNVTDPTFLDDELSPEVVEGLMSATERHYHLAQRYMRLKAKALGISDFSSHDVLAPISADERKVTFDEARAYVLDAFSAFEPKFAQIAREFFERRWIDVMPRPGKRDGAFCSGMLPSLHPYVLLNFNGRVEDVATLAHELGHGIHFYLSRQQTPLNFWPTTPLAETASVFGELLLMQRLLEAEKDPARRRALLAVRIEDILSTVLNQVSYTRWEQRAHARRAEGVVPAEELGALWLDERKKLYGDAVKQLPRDRWGWISIGHFVHYRFYCYSYAFGQLLVLALFQRYQQEGAGFIPKYVELLSSGCSASPEQMLKKVGVDLADPNFWSQGFKTLEALIHQFEEQV